MPTDSANAREGACRLGDATSMTVNRFQYPPVVAVECVLGSDVLRSVLRTPAGSILPPFALSPLR
jgi:hypothetical protein